MPQPFFTYGAWTPQYPPAVSIVSSRDEQSILKPGFADSDTGTSRHQFERQTWRVKGQFVGTPIELRDLVISAKEALSQPHGDLILRTAGGDVVQQIVDSLCLTGVFVESFELPDLDRDELAAVVTWSAQFTCDPPLLDGDGTPYIAAIRIDTESEDTGGATRTRVSGEIIGRSWQTRLDMLVALLLGTGEVIERRTIVQLQDGARIRFSLVLNTGASLEVYDWEERIELQVSLPIYVVRPVLSSDPNALPVVQTAGRGPVTITESGSCVGRTGWPGFPASRYSQWPEIEARKEKRSPTLGPMDASGARTAYGFPISWTYSHIVGVLTIDPPDPLDRYQPP